MRQSEDLNELFTALSAAQGEIENAVKDSNNPHFKSRYADLASVRDAIRKPFAKYGLSFIQTLRTKGRTVTVETILAHKSGQFISEMADWTALNETPQAMASASTYGRRYGISAMAGVAPDDDDGNAASAGNGNGKAPAGFISDEQELQLRDMIESVGADERKMCGYFKVDNLASLAAAQFSGAMQMLQQKAAKQ